MSTQPHIQHYQILRSQFSYAVDQAASILIDDDEYDRPFDNLGEHLVILYGRGHLRLDEDDSILQRFLTKSAPAIRTHAIQFIGESLWREDETEIPNAVRERFTTLWDWYWHAIGEADARKNPTSSTFGFWFISGVFEAQWALERLEQFVKVVPKPEPDWEILKKIAEIGPVNILRSLRIVGCLVDGDDENWRIMSWRNEAKAILRLAMEADQAAHSEAVVIIDRLGRRGFVEFGELLK